MAALAAISLRTVICTGRRQGPWSPQAAPWQQRRQRRRQAVQAHAQAQQQQQQQQAAAAASPAGASGSAAAGGRPRTASEAARAYYDAYNRKDIAAVLQLIAPDCVYEDLIHQEAFVGRKAVAAYFGQIEKLVPADIQFCVEDITEGDPRRCGVRWHVTITDDRGEQVEFPFSRGVSFYEVNAEGQIVFARDIVEPALKPGNAALKGIGVVAPLVRKLGPNANPAALKSLPLAAGAMWAFYAAYLSLVMLSPEGGPVPGVPAWQTPPEALQAVLNESLNFFYVNIGMAQLGLNPVPCVAEHPVSEGLFNFMNAWSLMWWPVMLADPRGGRVKNRFGLWLGTAFLTNVFFPVYLAMRLAPDGPAEAAAQPQAQQAQQAPALPGYAPAIGGLAAAVGAFSVGWALVARPELGGDLAERWAYLTGTMLAAKESRVDWAFVVDAGLYSVWQAWLLGACRAPAPYRFTPFFGLAAWLVEGGPRDGGAAEATAPARRG